MKKHNFFLILPLLFLIIQTKAQLSNGVVAYWKLDESSGSVIDASGVHNGTNVSGTPGQSGKIYTSYSFSASSGIDMGNDAAFNFGSSSDFTLSAWFRTTSNQDQYIIAKFNTGITPGLVIGTDAGLPYAAIMDGTGSGTEAMVIVSGPNAVNDDQWHLLTVTFDRNGSLKLYIGATEVANGDISVITESINNSNSLCIGYRDYPASPKNFNGSIDEVGIWSRVLSSGEVAELYNSGTGLAYPFNINPPPGDELTVSPTSLSYSSAAGTQTVNVTSNTGWTVSDDQSWITTSVSSGSGNGSFNVSATANSGAARSGTVTVVGGTVTRTISVSQAASGEISLSPSSLSLPSTSGTYNVTVTSPGSWSATKTDSWITSITSSGTTGGNLAVTVAENTTGNSRSGNITVTSGSVNTTLSVTQTAAGSGGSTSPWSDDGDVFVLGKKVGIGTGSPSQLLEISGINATKFDGTKIAFTRNDGPSYITSELAGGYITFVTNGRNISNANGNLVLKADLGSYFNGNLGIGTDNPNAKLEINSSGAIYSGTPTFLIRDLTARGTMVLESVMNYPTDLVFKNNGAGRIWLSSRESSSEYSFNIYTNPDGNSTPDKLAMTIKQNGNVGIGTTSPDATLTVNGNIKAERIDVVSAISLNGILNAGQIRIMDEVPASDHVFQTDYNLMTLADLDAFIKANKHLPEVPSAEEFKENGYSVGEMDDMLLRKVEELTLYILEISNEYEVLKSRYCAEIKHLQEQINEIQRFSNN
jgi:hypothetical protein